MPRSPLHRTGLAYALTKRSHQQQDCQERRAEHGTNSTAAGWYHGSSIKPCPGPSVLLVTSAELLDRAADTHRRGAPQGRICGTSPSESRIRAQKRDDSESCLGRAPNGASARSAKSCEPAGATGLGLVWREQCFSYDECEDEEREETLWSETPAGAPRSCAALMRSPPWSIRPALAFSITRCTRIICCP